MKRKEIATPFTEKSEKTQEILVQKLSLLIANRDQIFNRLENNEQSSHLDKALEKTLSGISEIEAILKNQQDTKPGVLPKSTNKIRYSLDEKSSQFISWTNMPAVHWLGIIGFLNKKEFGRILQVSKIFLPLCIEFMRVLARTVFSGFDMENIGRYQRLSFFTQLKFFNEIKEEYDTYYTLIDRSYIPLFSALKNYDQETAIDFINDKIEATRDTQENVTDMVFCSKRKDGKTAIIIAGELRLQDFLNFCFEKLILEGHILNKGKYSLVKTPAHLNDLLKDSKMSVAALWMGVIWSICNQKGPNIIYQPSWDKTWADIDNDFTSSCITICSIAALLGSYSVLHYSLGLISSDEKEGQILTRTRYQENELYHNTLPFIASPLVHAILGKNTQMIAYLLPLTRSNTRDWEEVNYYQTQLMAWYIENRDLTGLQNCISQGAGVYLATPIAISPKHFGITSEIKPKDFTLLKMVLVTGWQPGIDLLFSAAAQDKGEKGTNYETPLFEALNTGKIEILKQLVKHKASLTVQYPIPECHERKIQLEYPLITATIFEDIPNYDAINKFIINQIGHETAIKQINDSLGNIINDSQAISTLTELRDELLKELEHAKLPKLSQASPIIVLPISILLYSSGNHSQPGATGTSSEQSQLSFTS